MRPPPPIDVASVPIAVSTLARVLSRHDDYRVQSRVRPMHRREEGLARTGELGVCVLDVKTIDEAPLAARIIELSLQTVRIDAHGRIVDSGRNFAWFEDPGVPVPLDVVKATGISDDDVRGRSISEGEAYGEVSSADLVLSHNHAARPLVEKRLDLGPKPWICSERDLDWSEHGFGETSLRELLRGFDRFYDAGGAAAEVTALLHLLDRRLNTGGTVMKELIRSAAQPTWLVTVAVTPTSARRLPGRGYVLGTSAGCFFKEVGKDQVEAESEWIARNVLHGRSRPKVRRITWKERYAG